MAIAKFKIDLSGIPKEILQEEGGDKILKLRISTPRGPKTLCLRDNEVICTEDEFVIHTLTHYRPPRIPIKHRPGVRKKSVYHDYGRHKKKRPFTPVDAEVDHHHNL